ncbi:MAG TPA: hypothetical protein VFZ66_21255 [Herpetosiphonaceae bacterium]
MVTFLLVVTSDFWDAQRRWPAGCRPVIFSTDMVMKNAGTVQVPAEFADEVERLLRENPHVLSVKLAPLVFPRHTEALRRRAA